MLNCWYICHLISTRWDINRETNIFGCCWHFYLGFIPTVFTDSLSLKLITDFERISQSPIIPNAYHENVEITNYVLGLRLSCKWLPLIDDDVIETIHECMIPVICGQLSIRVIVPPPKPSAGIFENLDLGYLPYPPKINEFQEFILKRTTVQARSLHQMVCADCRWQFTNDMLVVCSPPCEQ